MAKLKYDDKLIAKIFKEKKVIAINFINNQDEILHLQNALKDTNNIFLRNVISNNLKKFKNDPDLQVIINHVELIKRNYLLNNRRRPDILLIPLSIIKQVNINNIEIGNVEEKLTYNLYELTYFKEII